MYNFLNKNEAISFSLVNKFRVQISHKTFSNNVPYILIDLPCAQEKLIINNEEMFVVAHHYTMPQKKEDKSIDSIYHYTLELKDAKDQQYKTHLYFDKLDRIIVEPKLLTAQSFISLNERSMKEIYGFAFPSTAVISFIRDTQKETIKQLINQIEFLEKEFTTLSENTKMIETQINLLNNLELLGQHFYINERKFYERLLQKINEKAPERIDKRLEENAVLDNEDLSEEKQKIVKKNKARPKFRTKPQPVKKPTAKKVKNSNPRSHASLIKACNQSIIEFDQSSNLPADLIEQMIDQVVRLRSIQLFDSSVTNLEQLLELKAKLSTKIRECANDISFLKDPLHLLAVKANVMHLNDTFIIEAIREDNVNIIKELLSLDRITDSIKISLRDCENYNFTLVECCVYYNAVNCFQFLLDNKFSLDYINEENSPFFMLLTNYSKAIKFSSILKFNSFEKLNIRLIDILEKRQTACIDDSNWTTIKKKQIETLTKIIAFYRKDPKYKFIFFHEVDFSKLNPKILDAYQRHLGAQEVFLSYLEKFYNEVSSTPLNVFLNRKKNVGDSWKEHLNLWITELNSMSAEDAVNDIMDAYQQLNTHMDECNSLSLLTAFKNLSLKGDSDTTSKSASTRYQPKSKIG